MQMLKRDVFSWFWFSLPSLLGGRELCCNRKIKICLAFTASCPHPFISDQLLGRQQVGVLKCSSQSDKPRSNSPGQKPAEVRYQHGVRRSRSQNSPSQEPAKSVRNKQGARNKPRVRNKLGVRNTGTEQARTTMHSTQQLQVLVKGAASLS